MINCAFVGLLNKSEKEFTRLATNVFAKPLSKQKSEKYYLFRVGVYSLSLSSSQDACALLFTICGLSGSSIYLHITYLMRNI